MIEQSNNSMRAFIAINLPKEVKDYLFDLQKDFKDFGKINFITKKNIHLTLKFLGSIDGNKLKQIKEKLSKIKLKSFEVSLNSTGVFPNKDFMRVLWVNLNPKDKVLELAKNIDQELIEFSNKQEFSDHITLGRIKFLKNKQEFLKKLEIKIKPIKFKVNSFELMKSDLSKDGPKYTVLETYLLE